jgi:hypothetical protein
MVTNYAFMVGDSPESQKNTGNSIYFLLSHPWHSFDAQASKWSRGLGFWTVLNKAPRC